MKYISPFDASTLALIAELPIDASKRVLNKAKGRLDKHTLKVARVLLRRKELGRTLKTAKPPNRVSKMTATSLVGRRTG